MHGKTMSFSKSTKLEPYMTANHQRGEKIWHKLK